VQPRPRSCSGVLSVDRAAKPDRRKTSFLRQTPTMCGQAHRSHDERLVVSSAGR